MAWKGVVGMAPEPFPRQAAAPGEIRQRQVELNTKK